MKLLNDLLVLNILNCQQYGVALITVDSTSSTYIAIMFTSQQKQLNTQNGDRFKPKKYMIKFKTHV